MIDTGKSNWRKRADDNASFMFHLAEWAHLRRHVRPERAAELARRAARRFPMTRHDMQDRISRALDWVVSQTAPRKGQELAPDRLKKDTRA